MTKYPQPGWFLAGYFGSLALMAGALWYFFGLFPERRVVASSFMGLVLGMVAGYNLGRFWSWLYRLQLARWSARTELWKR